MLSDTALMTIALAAFALHVLIVGELFDKRPGWPIAHALAAIASLLLIGAAINVVWVLG